MRRSTVLSLPPFVSIPCLETKSDVILNVDYGECCFSFVYRNVIMANAIILSVINQSVVRLSVIATMNKLIRLYLKLLPKQVAPPASPTQNALIFSGILK